MQKVSIDIKKDRTLAHFWANHKQWCFLLYLLSWAGLPYYDDLELDIPVDYEEDYTLQERLGTAGRQQPLQTKKVLQDYSTLSGNNGEKKERKHKYIQHKHNDTHS